MTVYFTNQKPKNAEYSTILKYGVIWKGWLKCFFLKENRLPCVLMHYEPAGIQSVLMRTRRNYTAYDRNDYSETRKK